MSVPTTADLLALRQHYCDVANGTRLYGAMVVVQRKRALVKETQQERRRTVADIELLGAAAHEIVERNEAFAAAIDNELQLAAQVAREIPT